MNSSLWRCKPAPSLLINREKKTPGGLVANHRAAGCGANSSKSQREPEGEQTRLEHLPNAAPATEPTGRQSLSKLNKMKAALLLLALCLTSLSEAVVVKVSNTSLSCCG